ncbi:MAG: hypothetical protein A4E70_01349 [Syntrophus sp. PtaU1.Bin005]|nr:MAG: hypothetical protein A4E69_00906 [Syntrophus sp. PtaB.Bin138]OPY81265.1 MAG: hypothetical protein A4E70_01349 [Syntrophus sp. PtaU1.Bin005]
MILCQVFSASLASLKTMVNVANLEPQPFDPVTGVDFQVDIRTYVSFMPLFET